MTDLALLYTAYYCEENIWQLCQHPYLRDRPRRALFISNPSKCCALWYQRAAAAVNEPVFWDYHVILLAQGEPEQPWEVWDLDTLLRPFPLSLPHYLDATFAPPGQVPEHYAPWFRVLTPEDFEANFASDRSHMKDAQGQWLKPPPTWAPIGAPGAAMNLMRFVDMDQTFVGEVMKREGLVARFG